MAGQSAGLELEEQVVVLVTPHTSLLAPHSTRNTISHHSINLHAALWRGEEGTNQ